MLIKRPDCAGCSLRPQGEGTVTHVEGVHFLVDHVGAVAFTGKDIRTLKVRGADFLVTVTVTGPPDNVFHFVPLGHFIRQNVVCSPWCLITHLFSSLIMKSVPVCPRTLCARYHLSSYLPICPLSLTRNTYAPNLPSEHLLESVCPGISANACTIHCR